MFSRKLFLKLSLIILFSFGVVQFALAECPCNKSNQSVNSHAGLTPIAASAYQTPYSLQAHFSQSGYNYPSMQYSYGRSGFGSMNSQPVYAQPMNAQPMISQPAMSAYPVQSAVRANPTPPPGTIGQTFKLPSRPVPVDKHPRVGMIDIKIHDAKQVIVHDMNAMRTEDTIDGFKDAKSEDIWHFESKPLYPGLDHIYRVQATFVNPDGSERKAEKYVRLIMGRVVELTF